MNSDKEPGLSWAERLQNENDQKKLATKLILQHELFGGGKAAWQHQTVMLTPSRYFLRDGLKLSTEESIYNFPLIKNAFESLMAELHIRGATIEDPKHKKIKDIKKERISLKVTIPAQEFARNIMPKLGENDAGELATNVIQFRSR